MTLPGRRWQSHCRGSAGRRESSWAGIGNRGGSGRGHLMQERLAAHDIHHDLERVGVPNRRGTSHTTYCGADGLGFVHGDLLCAHV